MRSVLFGSIRCIMAAQAALGASVTPPGLAAIVSGTSVTLTVADNTGGLGQSILQQSTNGVVFSTIATLSPGSLVHQVTGLVSGTTYYFRAISQIGANSSEPSGVITRTIAAPSAGIVADGEILTVRIAGAGSNIPPAYQEFTGGHDGIVATNTVGNKFEAVMSPGWGQPGNDGPYVNADRTLNGPHGLRNACDFPYLNAFQHGIRFDTGQEREVMYCRYSFYFDNPNNSGNASLPANQRGQLKQVRFVGSLGAGGGIQDDDYANVYLTWGGNGHQISYNSTAGNLTKSSGFDTGAFGYWVNASGGEWLTNEVRITRNSAPNVADGQIRVITRRSLTGEIVGYRQASNMNWTSANDDPLLRYFVLQMYMGNGFDSAVKTYIDRDIFVAWSDTRTAPKVIQLGDAPTYSACTTLTDCKFTEWTDFGSEAEISFKANLGRHADPSNLYVYALSDAGTVINATGVRAKAAYVQPAEPTLLYSNDFSANTLGVADSHNIHRFAVVTPSRPYWGTTRSVRVNLKNGVTDPITGNTGDSLRTIDFDPRDAVPDFDPELYNSMTVVLPFKLDDALWGGQTDPKRWEGKLVYIGHKGASTEQGFYLAGGMGGTDGRLNVGDNWATGAPWDGWQNRSYGWRDTGGVVRTAFNARTNMSWGTDGQWHRLRIQFDFQKNLPLASRFTKCRVFIDGFPIKGYGSFANCTDADGWFSLPPEFIPCVIRGGYGEATSANASTDRTSGIMVSGYAAGLEWAKPEYWTGIVNEPWLPSQQPALVPLPVNQYWVGDSQINGRASGLCTSNVTATRALWYSFYTASWNTGILPMGSGGRELSGHMSALQAAWGTSSTQRPGPEWVHIVETGGQGATTQATPQAYGDVFVSFMRWIKQKSPNAIVSIETPFSFGRENIFSGVGGGRDWTTYRIELLARIELLKAEGITVRMVDNDYCIRELERRLTPAQVWYQPGTTGEYHFTEVGNLMTAVAIYWYMGHDVSAINFAPILAEGLVTQAQIDAILAVIASIPKPGVA